MARALSVGVFLLLAWFSASSISAQQCSVDGELSPHPTDCTLYFICNGGSLVEQSCPDGLWFNPNFMYCDFPDVAFCNPGGSSTTSTQTPTETTSSGTPGPGYPMPCPEVDDPENLIRYPHASNCQYYYLCQNGHADLFTCVGTNEFNPIERMCQPANEAGCDSCPDVQVEGVLVRLPHASVCRYYYLCELGAPTLYQCSDALNEFSRYDRLCVRPEEAYCDL